MHQEGIEQLPGVGPKLRARLESALGGAEAVTAALETGDVAALARVQGISHERAVALVRAHRGDSLDWLMTDHARDLARDALAPFLSRAVTPMGRARLETLSPTADGRILKDRLKEARTRLRALAKVDLGPVRRALANVETPTTPRAKPERDLTMLLEEGPLLEEVHAEGLDRWVDIVTEADGLLEGTLVLGATLRELPRGAIHVTPRHAWEVVPWADLAWAETNREVLEALHALAPVLDVSDDAGPILEALATGPAPGDVDLTGVADACLQEANAAIEEGLEAVTLSGRDLLEVMQGGTSAKVESLVAKAASEARRRFQKETGLTGDPFSDTFPLQVDHRELARLEHQLRGDAALSRYKAAVGVAQVVRRHRDGIEEMVDQAIELDAWQAVATAATELGLTLPRTGPAFAVEGALHLSLEGEGDPVDYPVPNGVALLTGANSGGKTTLLETLGQVAVLAHLGLPVPARDATVPVLDGLAYYARPRQLGAGAFEGFLRTIEPVLLTEDRVLVLADELEAMTELEAASAILAEVVTRLEARGCPSVLVTHLAPFILAHVEVRVDGIEARGLGEDDELLVDRTPKVGKLARSTPELILRRLRNQAEGERRGLYEAMLARLQRE